MKNHVLENITNNVEVLSPCLQRTITLLECYWEKTPQNYETAQSSAGQQRTNIYW